MSKPGDITFESLREVTDEQLTRERDRDRALAEQRRLNEFKVGLEVVKQVPALVRDIDEASGELSRALQTTQVDPQGKILKGPIPPKVVYQSDHSYHHEKHEAAHQVHSRARKHKHAANKFSTDGKLHQEIYDGLIEKGAPRGWLVDVKGSDFTPFAMLDTHGTLRDIHEMRIAGITHVKSPETGRRIVIGRGEGLSHVWRFLPSYIVAGTLAGVYPGPTNRESLRQIGEMQFGDLGPDWEFEPDPLKLIGSLRVNDTVKHGVLTDLFTRSALGGAERSVQHLQGMYQGLSDLAFETGKYRAVSPFNRLQLAPGAPKPERVWPMPPAGETPKPPTTPDMPTGM